MLRIQFCMTQPFIIILNYTLLLLYIIFSATGGLFYENHFSSFAWNFFISKTSLLFVYGSIFTLLFPLFCLFKILRTGFERAVSIQILLGPTIFEQPALVSWWLIIINYEERSSQTLRRIGRLPNSKICINRQIIVLLFVWLCHSICE